MPGGAFGAITVDSDVVVRAVSSVQRHSSAICGRADRAQSPSHFILQLEPDLRATGALCYSSKVFTCRVARRPELEQVAMSWGAIYLNTRPMISATEVWKAYTLERYTQLDGEIEWTQSLIGTSDIYRVYTSHFAGPTTEPTRTKSLGTLTPASLSNSITFAPGINKLVVLKNPNPMDLIWRLGVNVPICLSISSLAAFGGSIIKKSKRPPELGTY